MKKLILSLIGAVLTCSVQAVTFNVTVPEGTNACFIAGNFNNWDAVNAVEMQRDGNNHFTLTLDNVTDAMVAEGYKYLSGPAWKYVEKGPSGEEIGNRTSIGTNDVVSSWAAIFDNSVKETNIQVNGYQRKVKVYLPADYETSGVNYPVVYSVGVNQRYSNAGSDDNEGDDFFGKTSWNAHHHAAGGHTEHGEGCILVAVQCHVAEAIPFAHSDFAGSGSADRFLQEYIQKVVGYVTENYRVKAGADNATIIGGDLGGLLALYATMKYPDTFGRCVAMSPMLWICHDEMLALANNASGKYLLAYGTSEPMKMGASVSALKEELGGKAQLLTIAGGKHEPTSWSAALPAIYPYFIGKEVATTSVNMAPEASRVKTRAAADADYTFYYSQSSESSLEADNSVTFEYTENYVTKGGHVKNARVALKDISSSFKSKCYWNVMDNATGAFLQSTAGNVSFSSKKTARSWLRVVVYDDGTVENVAASSKGFRAVAADGTINMATDYDNHKTSATLGFTGNDKSFAIHFGSVNSESDMGTITQTYTVGENCLEAEVEYDFLTNSVAITETKWGANVGNIKIVRLSASPAVTYAGQSSRISLTLDSDCTPVAKISKNYGDPTALSLTASGQNSWTANVSNLERGIYHITIDAKIGDVTKEKIGRIAIKVIADNQRHTNPQVTVNAYEGVDWASTGRYKANFHTHTSQSFDTQYTTSQVVDSYHDAGYQILALTDHDYNSYPWEHFDLFNNDTESRDASALGMLAIPSVELSKDNTNSWSETANTGDFNHHNDFFTGRKGQEFATLRESYAYTDAIGGMQIINHPGQYWNLSTTYTPGEKNSPEWHAENFQTYPSLVGLEVYNQGNRRPNDRILWDQILDRTMPERAVWGYSCDDTHTTEQYFRNYQFMLMPELTTDALKTAMSNGSQYFSYEYTGSGEAKAPRINEISVDNEAHTISIDSDADQVVWISGTDKSGAASTRESTVVGIGKNFDFNNFQGNYVRALLTNEHGETATQPFGFNELVAAQKDVIDSNPEQPITFNYNGSTLEITARDPLTAVNIFNIAGQKIATVVPHATECTLDLDTYPDDNYIILAATKQHALAYKMKK